MHQRNNIGIDILERDDAVIVVVEGELDMSAAATFEESLSEASAGPASTIVLDLDRVTFMDSAGVHVLLQFSLSEGNRGRVALTPGSDQVRRLLDVTGVGRYLKFVPSPELDDARSSAE